MKKLLYDAARDADPVRISTLLANGADPNAAWHGYPPLHALIQKDAHTPAVVTSTILDCLHLLLRHGADPSQTGGFPPTSVMLLAAFAGAPAIIDALRTAGVPADPFLSAAEGRQYSLSPTATDAHGLQAIHYASGSRLPSDGKRDVVATLLAHGASPNASVFAGSHEITPIYLSASAGNKDVFDLLLRHGADPQRALTAAMWNTTGFEFAESACTHGANPDLATADGKPLLNHLIQWGRIRHAQWLLARNASPNIPCKDGWTALHQAVSRGNTRIIESLLARGADRYRKDRLGHTPADVAQLSGRPQLRVLLK
jgi:ankyrin repeat protein